MKKASSFLVLAIATVMIGTINANAVEMRGVSKVIGNEQNGPHDAETHPPIHVKHADLTSSTGYTPQQIKHAYSIDALKLFGVGQTIAIVDAYDDPTVLKDLAVFDHKYGLPVCTIANDCFSKVYSAGFKPRFNPGWAIEISLDVQWAHAIAPGAKILLVEAPNASLSSLLHAVDRAVAKGAHQVSMSWGAPEFSSETAFDFHFNKPGVTFFAASGDGGSGILYPAVSPHVTGVGGTTLAIDNISNVVAETAWSGSGGGISNYEVEPLSQTNFGVVNGGSRGVPDVSYDANPDTGFKVYDSAGYYGSSGWFIVGGTSAGAPQWAALNAIIKSGHPLHVPNNSAYYAAAANLPNQGFRDIVSGSNGIFTATIGYDYVTGLGSPIAKNLVPYLQTH